MSTLTFQEKLNSIRYIDSHAQIVSKLGLEPYFQANPQIEETILNANAKLLHNIVQAFNFPDFNSETPTQQNWLTPPSSYGLNSSKTLSNLEKYISYSIYSYLMNVVLAPSLNTALHHTLSLLKNLKKLIPSSTYHTFIAPAMNRALDHLGSNATEILYMKNKCLLHILSANYNMPTTSLPLNTYQYYLAKHSKEIHECAQNFIIFTYQKTIQLALTLLHKHDPTSYNAILKKHPIYKHFLPAHLRSHHLTRVRIHFHHIQLSPWFEQQTFVSSKKY